MFGLLEFSTRRPKTLTGIMTALTLVLVAGAAIPSLWPGSIPGLPSVKIDTDPENMLPADEPIRIFHTEMKAKLALYDMVVVGVVNEEHRRPLRLVPQHALEPGLALVAESAFPFPRRR